MRADRHPAGGDDRPRERRVWVRKRYRRRSPAKVQPRIPTAKIKENPGKQYELEKGTKGPVLTIPAIRSE